ncbi:MAG TPA: amidohydrolase family protein [Methylomirabilota bacterium]|nr:amidohydrolase family protein [Methylomirabilota bacterium]
MTSAVLSAAELLPPGHRPLPPGVHALANGRVVVQPGEVLEEATVVIRDGRIEAVGVGVEIPTDARIWDVSGTTIYAGLIDPHLVLEAKEGPVSTSMTQPISFASDGLNFYGVPGAESDPGRPGPGHSIAQVTPERRLADGYAPSAKVLEGLREIGFTAANVVPESGIIRGTSAFVLLSDGNPNQAIVRADVAQHVAFDIERGGGRAYPRSLMGVIAVIRQAFFDAAHSRLDQEHYEANLLSRPRPAFNPSLAALGPAVDREMPVVFEPGSALMVARAAQLAEELDVTPWMVSSGQEWRRPDLLAEVDAPFLVPLNFPEVPKMPEESDWDQVSLDLLRAWDWAPENAALLWSHEREVALTTHGLSDRKAFRKNLRLALDRGLEESDALAALTTIPARLCGVEDQMGTIEAGKLANLTVVTGESYFDPEAKIREVWIEGRLYRATPGGAKEKDQDEEEDAGEAEGDPAEEQEKETADGSKTKEKDKKAEEVKALRKQRTARSPLDGRGPLESPDTVLVEGATVWTCGPDGILESADLLVSGGRIVAVGGNLRERSRENGKIVFVDGRGRHVTPGLIDAHSHTAILGAVNEGTLPSTAMVRIGDVINSETENLYQQLAGGLTVANLLHGSANPIGGQNAVIKLKDGASPEDLKFETAPPGIKFALGENVKQSNWGDDNTSRFPQSRMGVRTFFENRFIAARQYLGEWERFEESGGRPPRRDLELEALGEISRGARWIHCHSYRQDEILAFLRLMEEFEVQVGTLQHVLEGYKVADEIAAHGAGASSFSDWWAYKFEVYDAIPHNGSLMHERGVLVSFNSDSSDLARRMSLEAAKAVKYGGTSEEEALNFVTLNPARQLRIEERVGSLEPGKDGDFVVWSGSPLDSETVCLQTWIEGRKYFDREQASERAAARERERSELLEKARKVLGVAKPRAGAEAAREAFFRRALEHAHDDLAIECMECGLPR